eukprot:2595809-Rhodomonas_salina.3
MKGARNYRKSKRQKGKKAAERVKELGEKQVVGQQETDTAPVIARAMKGARRVRFAPDTKSVSRPGTDDFLQAFGAQHSKWRWGQAFNAEHTLHIDYAHANSLGYNKEGYYLMLVVDSIDFTWASPTRLKADPEELLDDFVHNSCIKISKISMDLNSTMSSSESFAIWCKARDITMCLTAG